MEKDEGRDAAAGGSEFAVEVNHESIRMELGVTVVLIIR